MKKKTIIIIVAAVILVSLIAILFLLKINSKKVVKEDENNYTVKFDYYVDNKVNQRITFIYKDKALSDITLTLYFDTKDVARAVYNEYKKLGEFSKYDQNKNKVILYYKESDVSDYKTYNKDDLILEFNQMGYVYKK